MYYTRFKTELFWALMAGDEMGVSRFVIGGEDFPWPVDPEWKRRDAFFSEFTGQVHDYLAGKRRVFEIAIQSSGTEFQEAVWRELRGIPYGKTLSYGAIAAALGRPGAARAVGAACGGNPVPLLIPCHRVVAARNGLGGYIYGQELKRRLLLLEGAL